MSRRTLVTFVGLRDPYYHEPFDDGRQLGPVLSVLSERSFERVILLIRSFRQEQGEATRVVLEKRQPSLQVVVKTVHWSDSTYHPEILAELRRVWALLLKDAPDDDFTVSLLSGPPEVHACWVLLHTAGEVVARLINATRTVHDGLAGPRGLRELEWSQPLAKITPEALSMLTPQRERFDESDLQDPTTMVPRHFFARRTLEQSVLMSRHRSPVLICGETGTQKHYLSAMIHRLSRRQAGPLIVLNCGSIPTHLFEVVLFGESVEGGDGKLVQADGGSLVLLKLHQIPGEMLLKLFRALDDGSFYARGSRRATKMDVRLLATTDRDLEDEVRLGRFPAEIWKRLQASVLRLPPLRERKDELLALANEELERLNRSLPRPKRLSRAAVARLESHTWPSNVSEFRRVLEQAVVSAEGPVIDASDLDFDLGVNLSNLFTSLEPRMHRGFSLTSYLRNLKYELVRSALRKTGGRQSEAARLLGVTPQAVHKYSTALARPRSEGS